VTTPAEPPVREVRARSAVDSMATQAKTNGNGVPRSPDSDVVDLEVPSFLRRKRDASDDD
jgi:hypothetical protein